MMTRRALFIAAHALTRMMTYIYRADYRATFAAALKLVHAHGKAVIEVEEKGQRAWLASVTGRCQQYGFERRFIGCHGRTRISSQREIKRWRAAELDGLYQLSGRYGREWWFVAAGVAVELQIDELDLRGLWPAPRALAA